MKAKEKAKQLIMEFYPIANDGSKDAKRCATIAVDNIIEAIETTTGHCTLRRLDLMEVHSDIKYWQEVKQEINNL